MHKHVITCTFAEAARTVSSSPLPSCTPAFPFTWHSISNSTHSHSTPRGLSGIHVSVRALGCTITVCYSYSPSSYSPVHVQSPRTPHKHSAFWLLFEYPARLQVKCRVFLDWKIMCILRGMILVFIHWISNWLSYLEWCTLSASVFAPVGRCATELQNNKQVNAWLGTDSPHNGKQI